MKILNREGSKYKYKDLIIPYFPVHTTYIEPFFGTGAIFFNKPLARYNLINDSSSFIYELWDTFRSPERVDALYKEIEGLLCYDKVLKETNSLASKLLFGVISFMNTSCSIIFDSNNDKKILLHTINSYKNIFSSMLSQAMITNKDVFQFLNAVSWQRVNNTFTYCDPPYSISKGRMYDNKGWNIEKLEQLITFFIDKNIKVAISEYNDSRVLELFDKYGFVVKVIASSQFTTQHTSKSSKSEILAMNYKKEVDLFDYATEEKKYD